MHAKGNEAASDVPTVPPVDDAGRCNPSLIDYVKQFARPMRGRPERLILDGFDSQCFILFDFEADPETPESLGTCDIGVVPLHCGDYSLDDVIWLVSNAKLHGVMRFLAALGIQRFDDKVKTAFYSMTNPLR